MVLIKVAKGRRDLMSELNLKKRKFIGNTSMDAQLSLIMANIAQVKSGDFVLDPFVGSGKQKYIYSNILVNKQITGLLFRWSLVKFGIKSIYFTEAFDVQGDIIYSGLTLYILNGTIY